MPAVSAEDLDRMRSNLLFDGPDRSRKLSRFWILLLLASCIASAGVISDSTATVIGAMIVAPLMIPIMGTVLSITTSDRDNLVLSVGMIVAGAAAAIAVGYLFGLMAPIDIVANTSSQVAGRVNPRLIDLLAAVATGAVGAFAQCRADDSDTQPGVAIAISLVPPLAVVGLTLEGGEPSQAFGALLLFLTNVAAILLTGVVVMAIFGVHKRSLLVAQRTLNRKRAVWVVIAMVVVIAVPLGVATVSLTRETSRNANVGRAANQWANDSDWLIISVGQVQNDLTIVATGPLPIPETDSLRRDLDAAGLKNVKVTIRLIPEERIVLEGS